jgi:hypothetical protein
LGDDYITPHKNRRRNGIPDTMVNPVPISFLKVLPGVLFRFQFELHDFRKEKYTLLSKAQVEQLFKNLLLELGLGAKTHVGYGQFALPSPDPGSQSSTIGSTTRKMNTPSGGESSFVVGQEVEAYINRVNWAENKLELRVDGNRGTIAPMQVAKNVLSDLAKQRKIKVWIRAVNDEGSIKYLGITPPKSTT